ncbi:MAG: NAD(P)-binding domain-containing protein [Actinomycetota bacterium]|nr:NAD(P)-binding domain-containing protein [Actinomycetota bacterium]
MVRARHRAPKVIAAVPVDPTLPRACIIGAGSCGIAAAKALSAAGIPFDCFEQGPVIGGNWVFDNPNGWSACYQSLEINTSCPRMAFSDFPMPGHLPHYAKHFQVREYFEAYVDHFGIRDALTVNTRVQQVQRCGDRWTVQTSGPAGEQAGEYDAVLVANGHHWDERWPEPAYPGHFDGEQLHSHSYRSAEQLRGRNVLVVGMGNSAMDIAVEASVVGASSNISVRRGQWVIRKTLLGFASDQVALPGWMPWWAQRLRLVAGARLNIQTSHYGLPRPDHRPWQSHPVQSDRFAGRLRAGAIIPRPAIDRLDGSGVVFVDGSRAPVDLVIWCTGYRVGFPFLDPRMVAAPGNELPLWKRTVHPELPGLYFVGLLQPIGAVMPLAQAQSEWIAEMLTGQYVSPPRETISRQLRREHQRNKSRFYASDRHTMEVDFDNYLWDLKRERRRGAVKAREVAALAPVQA